MANFAYHYRNTKTGRTIHRHVPLPAVHAPWVDVSAELNAEAALMSGGMPDSPHAPIDVDSGEAHDRLTGLELHALDAELPTEQIEAIGQRTAAGAACELPECDGSSAHVAHLPSVGERTYLFDPPPPTLCLRPECEARGLALHRAHDGDEIVLIVPTQFDEPAQGDSPALVAGDAPSAAGLSFATPAPAGASDDAPPSQPPGKVERPAKATSRKAR